MAINSSGGRRSIWGIVLVDNVISIRDRRAIWKIYSGLTHELPSGTSESVSVRRGPSEIFNPVRHGPSTGSDPVRHAPSVISSPVRRT